MADEFEVLCVRAGGRLRFRRTADGGETFIVSYESPWLTAHIEVYDDNMHAWSALFLDLESNWTGWDGSKSHESTEGHLTLACTSDRVGHISMWVVLQEWSNSPWSAEFEVSLEAGQLARLAKRAVAFWGPVS